MDTKNQLEGGRMQVNPRKIMQKNINELYERVNQLGGAMSLVVQKIEFIEKNMGGLEEITMKLAEFFDKRDEFNDYIQDWLQKDSESSQEKSKTVNIAGNSNKEVAKEKKV